MDNGSDLSMRISSEVQVSGPQQESLRPHNMQMNVGISMAKKEERKIL